MNDQQLMGSTSVIGCTVCNCPLSIPVFVKDGFTIARCIACRTLHVSERPTDEVLLAHYQNPVYFRGVEDQGYRNYVDMRKALLPHFKRRLRIINAHSRRPGRLLDVGCAAGYFLEIACRDGWQVAGIEPSSQIAQMASKALHVPIALSLDTLSETEFDVITMWDVVEHFSQPVAELRRLWGRLRPGGLLMLSTPNTDHWQAVREPGIWTGYRPPFHLTFFTQQTLEDALRRAAFGHIGIRKVSPLPPLPSWLHRISTPLQHDLAVGQASVWLLALLVWRAIRIFGWGWQLIAHPKDDIFATLEALAFRPT